MAVFLLAFFACTQPNPEGTSMDTTQKLVERLVERRMQNTGESQAVATANVMAAFEKLRKNKK